MVRETLGDEAIIVATREEKGGPKGGGGVHVTAAVEPHFELGRGGTRAAESKDWLQYDGEDEESAIAEEITEAMLRHSVPEDVMDNILSCATVVGLDSPGKALIAALEHLYNFSPLPETAHDRALMLVGPPGGGKTLAVAKMAARGAMNGLNIGVITTDTVRAGGVEQLAGFTRLLGIDLQIAENHQDLQAVLDNMEGMDQVLIDTAGCNAFDRDDMRALAQMIGVGDVEPVLAMAGGGDADEAGEVARAFATVGVNRLVATRLDATRRLGGILSAAHHGGMIFSNVSNSAKVAEGLAALSPKKLAYLLMPEAFRQQGASEAAQKRAAQ